MFQISPPLHHKVKPHRLTYDFCLDAKTRFKTKRVLQGELSLPTKQARMKIVSRTKLLSRKTQMLPEANNPHFLRNGVFAFSPDTVPETADVKELIVFSKLVLMKIVSRTKLLSRDSTKIPEATIPHFPSYGVFALYRTPYQKRHTEPTNRF
jgi:hypothetical protein